MELDSPVYQLRWDLRDCGLVQKPQHALDRLLVSHLQTKITMWTVLIFIAG
jgi:hypothetical protein